MKKTLPLIALTAILLVPVMSAYAAQGSTGQATGSVDIVGTCGITLMTNDVNNPSTLNFGALAPSANQESAATDNPLTITDSGTVPATSLTVTGADWFGKTPTIQGSIPAADSFFDILQPDVNGKPLPGPQTPLINNQPVLIGSNPSPGSPVVTEWYLIPNISPANFIGSLTQSLTFTTGC